MCVRSHTNTAEILPFQPRRKLGELSVDEKKSCFFIVVNNFCFKKPELMERFVCDKPTIHHCPPSFQWICILQQHSSSSAVASLWHQSSMTIWPLFVSVSSADNDHLCKALENLRKDELWEHTRQKQTASQKENGFPSAGTRENIQSKSEAEDLRYGHTISTDLFMGSEASRSNRLPLSNKSAPCFYLQIFKIFARLRGNTMKDV